MDGMNKVLVGGNLVRDAELRTTRAGHPCLTFRIAITERKPDFAAGKWKPSSPVFVDCVLFGDRAKQLAELFKKGRAVVIDGRLRLSRWTTPANEKRSKMEVEAIDIHLVSAVPTGKEANEGGELKGKPERLEPAWDLFEPDDNPFDDEDDYIYLDFED